MTNPQGHIPPLAIQPDTLPPVLNAERLAALLDRAPSTVLGDVSRAPHKLPPWCTLPGTQRKVWLTATVLSWLAGFERAPAAAPRKPAHEEQPKKSKAGHPGNKKIAEAKAAGYESYAAWQRALRAQEGGAA